MTDTRLEGVEIVFFDAGGTLLCPDPDVGEVYAQIGRRFGISAAAADLRETFSAAFRRKQREQLPQSREWWRDVVAGSFAPFGVPADPAALFDELYGHFARPAAWRLLPGARETLATVNRRGLRSGLISNWDDRLAALLAGLEVAELLDPIVVSSQVGAEKPDARIFRVALERAGVAPRQAVMVGDDPEADVAGAARVGLRVVQLGGKEPAAGNVLRVEKLIDLLDHLPAGPA